MRWVLQCFEVNIIGKGLQRQNEQYISQQKCIEFSDKPVKKKSASEMSQKMIIFVLLIDHQVWIHYSGDTRSHCLVGVLRRMARTGDSDTAAPAPAMSRMNKSSLGQFIKSKYISVFVRAWAI